MRELKFRVWNNRHNEFVRPDYGLIGFCYPLDGSISVLTTNGEPMKNCIIEQYTDLKDKNGKEIYEGDILDDGEGHIGKVLYNERIASFAYEWGNCGSAFMGLYTSDMKVIGNIHENPELLEER